MLYLFMRVIILEGQMTRIGAGLLLETLWIMSQTWNSDSALPISLTLLTEISWLYSDRSQQTNGEIGKAEEEFQVWS